MTLAEDFEDFVKSLDKCTTIAFMSSVTLYRNNTKNAI